MREQMICPVLELIQKVEDLMRRTEQLQGLRLMKFDEVYGRTYRGELSQLEAAEILGMSERTFRRWRDRFEAEGAEGLYDRRLGRVSARRAGVDEVVALLDLVRQANWQKVGGASPPERRSNRTTFLREPCVGSREGAGEASVAAWMGRAIEHRKSDGPGCRGFQIGRRQYRRRRFGEMSASPAVSENPCTFARLLLGPWEVFKLPGLS